MSDRRYWTATLFLYIIVDGIATQARGALIPTFKDIFHVSDSLLGLVSPAFSIGYLITLFAIGMRAGDVDIKKFLLLGTVLTPLAMIFLGFSPVFFMILGSMFVRGLATGSVRGLDRPILSHLYPSSRSKVFNLFALFWAIGAASGPLLVNLSLSLGNWRLIFYFLFGLSFSIPFLVWKADLPQNVQNERSISVEELKEVVKSPIVIYMIVIILLDLGLEASLFTWLPYYASQYFSKSMSNVVLSVFLSSYIPGRYIYSVLSDRMDNLKVILISAAISIPFTVVALVYSEGILILVSIFFVGLLISGIMPTITAWSTNYFPERTGPINAIGMGSITVGYLIFPPFIGVVSDFYGISTAIKIPIVALIGLVIFLSYLMFKDVE